MLNLIRHMNNGYWRVRYYRFEENCGYLMTMFDRTELNAGSLATWRKIYYPQWLLAIWNISICILMLNHWRWTRIACIFRAPSGLAEQLCCVVWTHHGPP